jgi:glycosyltransferase involved in cell wall biosynthesis
MISLIIPTYRNPDYLDICLKSAIEQQTNKNEIIVAVDGFIEESRNVLDKYTDDIEILDLGNNQGMQTALNLAFITAKLRAVCIPWLFPKSNISISSVYLSRTFLDSSIKPSTATIISFLFVCCSIADLRQISK